MVDPLQDIIQTAADGTGTILYGGARMALLDIESGFWSLRRQVEALVGRGLSDMLMRQAGVNGGASLARNLLGRSPGSKDGRAARSRGSRAEARDKIAGEIQAFRDCVSAYQAAGFGRFEITVLKWPVGRIEVKAWEAFEAWAAASHGEKPGTPACSYTAGVLIGFVNVISGGHDVACRETSCAALGSEACVFDIVPAGPFSAGQAVAVDPDPTLSHQLNLLQILFDRMPMGIAVFDREMLLRRCNPTWAEFVTRHSRSGPTSVVPGTSFWELAPGADPHMKPIVEKALSGRSVREEAVPIVGPGVATYWDVALTPIMRDGEVAGIVDVTVDATERVRSYQNLEERVHERTREIEQKRAVAESLRDTVRVLNSDRPLSEVLEHIVTQAGRFLGTDKVALYRLDHETQLLTVQAARGLPDEYGRSLRVPLGQGVVGTAAARGEPVSSQTESLPAGPTDRTGDIPPGCRSALAVPLLVEEEVYGTIVLLYDEQRAFSKEEETLALTFADQATLAIGNASLRAEAEQAAVAAERNRLARELHDAVTQTLFSASLIAEVLPRIWERDPEEGQRRLDEIRQLARGALAEMRTLLLELRPAALTEVGLGDLLRQLGEAISGRTRIPVEVTVEGEGVIPAPIQVAFYRIAQEALNNMAKHSGAERSEVGLVFSGRGRVELSVSDDGCGFDPALVPAGHLGLSIMRERAEALGLELLIRTTPGSGTEVLAVWEE